jgi:hypothetical protein
MAALPDIDSGWNEGNEDNVSEMHNCYCPNCEVGTATTVMLPTKVPFFREIYIMSLFCEVRKYVHLFVCFTEHYSSFYLSDHIMTSSPSFRSNYFMYYGHDRSATFVIPR